MQCIAAIAHALLPIASLYHLETLLKRFESNWRQTERCRTPVRLQPPKHHDLPSVSFSTHTNSAEHGWMPRILSPSNNSTQASRQGPPLLLGTPSRGSRRRGGDHHTKGPSKKHSRLPKNMAQRLHKLVWRGRWPRKLKIVSFLPVAKGAIQSRRPSRKTRRRIVLPHS